MSAIKTKFGLGWLDFVGVAGVAFIVGAALYAVVFLSTPPSKERLACDRAVTSLLYSKDLAEITRAGILVRQLNCGIGRRLPAE